jgi:hypothetical protein
VSGPAGVDGFGRRLAGTLLAAALFGIAAVATVGFLLGPIAQWTRSPGVSAAFRDYLAAGGWLWIPMWSAAAGALTRFREAPDVRARLLVSAVALGLVLLPAVFRPVVAPEPGARDPVGRAARTRAIRKWAYGNPASVERLLAMRHEPDPVLREQVVLALGVNLVVSDVEHTSVSRPARDADPTLRARLGAALREAMGDSVESIRAEAARGLWRSPVAFGPAPVAAETLAAVLDRATRPAALERLAWLALDASAAQRDTTLRSAVARYAGRTPSPALARAARAVLAR